MDSKKILTIKMTVVNGLRLLAAILICVAVRVSCDLLFAHSFSDQYKGTGQFHIYHHRSPGNGTPLDTQRDG